MDAGLDEQGTGEAVEWGEVKALEAGEAVLETAAVDVLPGQDDGEARIVIWGPDFVNQV